jgi:hypothetical protein
LWNTGLLRLIAEAGDVRGPALASLPTKLVEGAEKLNGGPLTDDVAIVVLTNEPNS